MVAIVVSLIAAGTALVGTFMARKNHKEIATRLDVDREERRQEADARAAQSDLDRQCLAMKFLRSRLSDDAVGYSGSSCGCTAATATRPRCWPDIIGSD